MKLFETEDTRFMNAGLVQGTVNSIVEMIDSNMPQVHDHLVMKGADLLTILTTRIMADKSLKKVQQLMSNFVLLMVRNFLKSDEAKKGFYYKD